MNVININFLFLLYHILCLMMLYYITLQALPTEATVSAGSLPPKEVVAILRPSNFNPGSTDELDQKYIVRENFEMCLDIEFKAGAGQSVKFDPISAKNTTRKEYHGLYVFPVASIPSLFQKAGTYSFSFSLVSNT